jgi:hypothetical protein
MRLHYRFLVAVLGTALTPLAADAAELSRFDFDGGLAADAGPGTLSHLNGTTTSDAVTFGTASAFSLPGLPGGDAAVMQFPAFAPNQGLALLPNVPANGGGSYINRYTIFWDTYFPTIDDYMGLVQTSPANTTTPTSSSAAMAPSASAGPTMAPSPGARGTASRWSGTG